MGGLLIKIEDLDNGMTEEVVIEDDYLVIAHGHKHVGHVQAFPTTGGAQVTIKDDRF